MQAMAQANPTGKSLCSTVNGKDGAGNYYSMTRATCGTWYGETSWYHEMTCARFQ